MKTKWLGRLQAGVKRGHFTASDKKLAGSWNTCAVGEYHKANPKLELFVEWDEPFDSTLWNEGLAFTEAIVQDRVGDAVSAYHTITQRIKELK